MKLIKKYYVLLFIFSVAISSCTVPQIISSIPNLKYKIKSANNFSLADIPLSGKNKIKDFNPFDLIKLTAAAATKSISLTMTINLEIKNPGNKSEGKSSYSTLLKSFPWKLYLNNKEAVSGNIAKPLAIPTPGNSKVIPIKVTINIFKFISNNSISDILNLILKASNTGGKSTRIKLIAQPTFETFAGDFKWPNIITIVNQKL